MNVLIVDDSAAIRKIIARVLSKTSLAIAHVFEAGDGLEGVDILMKNRVELILSDIHMPNMDGLQFLQKVKSVPDWKSIPVVMVTTEGSQPKILEAVELGAAGFVKKPFSADQFSETLKKLF